MSDTHNRVLAYPTRAKILDYLKTEPKALPVKDIVEVFDLHQNVIRTHLTKLVEAGFVTTSLQKHPQGGRPFRVYKATHHPPQPHATQAEDGSLYQFPVSAASTLATVLPVELVLQVLAKVNDPNIPSYAWSCARTLGQRATQTMKPASNKIEDIALAIVSALQNYHVAITMSASSRDWAEISHVDQLFYSVSNANKQIAEIFERALLIGAADGLGVSITVERPTPSNQTTTWRIERSYSLTTTTNAATTLLDTTMMTVDEGVVAAMRAITGLRQNDILEVLTKNLGSPAKFARWADRAGHKVLAVERTQDHAGNRAIRLLIQKA